MTRYWTAREDALVLAYEPSAGRTLHDVARCLGRTYYACRLRRKKLLRDGLPPPTRCERCGAPLPSTVRRGYCADCRQDVTASTHRLRYRSGHLGTVGVAGNRFRRWTPAEDARIFAEPITINLARELGRTLKSCWARRERVQRRAG